MMRRRGIELSLGSAGPDENIEISAWRSKKKLDSVFEFINFPSAGFSRAPPSHAFLPLKHQASVDLSIA
jgi:hypothetical protein